MASTTQGVILICRKQYREDNWKKETVAPAFLEHCSMNGRYLVFEVNCLRPFFPLGQSMIKEPGRSGLLSAHSSPETEALGK